SIPPGQIDDQLALGAEDDGRPPLGQGQLRLAEVEQAGHRQEGRGPLAVAAQGAGEDPVVGADGPGAVGAAAGVLAEGAGAPDVGTGAVYLGDVTGPDLDAEEEMGQWGGGQLSARQAEPGEGHEALVS